MYRGLRLKAKTLAQEIRLRVLAEDSRNSNDTIRNALDPTGKGPVDLVAVIMQKTISVDELRETVFPIDAYQVFICHSHADEDLALGLAYFLHKKGLMVFVDSIYWHHYEKILRILDDRYC